MDPPAMFKSHSATHVCFKGPLLCCLFLDINMLLLLFELFISPSEPCPPAPPTPSQGSSKQHNTQNKSLPEILIQTTKPMAGLLGQLNTTISLAKGLLPGLQSCFAGSFIIESLPCLL